MQRRIHHFLINPIVIILPIVAGLLLGWNHYLFVTQHLNLSKDNLMPYAQFKTLDAQGVPKGWQIEKQGSLDYMLSEQPGHAGGNTLNVKLSHYTDGVLVLRSPVVNIMSNHTYFFKGYYAASAPFDVLIRNYYSDGTSSLKFIDTYPATDKATWSTVSSVITGAGTVQATQIVYHMHNNGTLQINGNYIEQRDTGLASTTPPRTNSGNLIPNNRLRGASYDYDKETTLPDSWTQFQAGKNRASFTYNTDSTPYLGVTVHDYTNGEAKWQYAPQKVTPGTFYTYTVGYQSNSPAPLTAEYTMEDGSYRFDTITTLPPSPEWTRMEQQFEVPKGAKSLVVTAALHGNGWLNTREHSLIDSTASGKHFFDRPLISLTFDDGWQSTYDNAVPILNTYHYKGTFYVNPLSIDTARFITTSEMQSLIHAKHEIASHGLKHINFTTVNTAELDTQLRTAETFVHDQTHAKHIDFATPYGESDAEVTAMAQRYYQSSRGTESGINTRQNFDAYNLRVLFLGPDMKVAQITQAIEEAKAHNGWLILVYHQVQDKKSQENIKPETFAEQLKVIQKSGIPVRTVADALQELYPQL